jgi:hypothetical protein
MRNLILPSDYKKAVKELLREFPAPSHVDVTLRADTTVFALDGTLIAVLLRNVIPEDLHLLAFELWKPINGIPSNRATAVGTRSLPRTMNTNGVASPRFGVNEHVLAVTQGRYGTLGYEGSPRCRRTPLTTKSPEMLEGNRPLIELVDRLYRQQLPDIYAQQLSEIKQAGATWRLWNTAFSTVYLAKNLRTGYHRDSGNVRGVMTAIMPTGKFRGGELVFPRWRISVAFKPGDLLFFNPQEVHGNLPIDGERISAAFYCGHNIARCRE